MGKGAELQWGWGGPVAFYILCAWQAFCHCFIHEGHLPLHTFWTRKQRLWQRASHGKENPAKPASTVRYKDATTIWKARAAARRKEASGTQAPERMMRRGCAGLNSPRWAGIKGDDEAAEKQSKSTAQRQRSSHRRNKLANTHSDARRGLFWGGRWRLHTGLLQERLVLSGKLIRWNLSNFRSLGEPIFLGAQDREDTGLPAGAEIVQGVFPCYFALRTNM